MYLFRMLFIDHNSSVPFFNLATEEYLLKEFTEDILMLYINERCVVVGKHQNTLAEINPAFIFDHHIPVVRRISGGGTVFHDKGNLNFTFIQNGTKDKLIDFDQFLIPLIDFLRTLNVHAVKEGKSNLSVGGRKISGNAEHIFKNRVLHHGTLLFSSDLEVMSMALTGNRDKYSDKAVRSLPRPVANICEHLKTGMDIIAFKSAMTRFFLEKYDRIVMYNLSSADISKIGQLAESKYRTREWNFDYSPAYSYNGRLETFAGTYLIHFEVSGGIIRHAVLQTVDGYDKPGTLIGQAVLDHPHHPDAILEILQGLIKEYPDLNLTRDVMLTSFF